MHRILLAVSILPVLLLPAAAQESGARAAPADVFDRHDGFWLRRAAQQSKPVPAVTEAASRQWKRLPGTEGPTLVVKTDQGNWAKLELDWGYRRGPKGLLRVLMLVRFQTYRAGQDQQVVARGRQRMLFPGFEFDLDLGQVVPSGLGGDLRLSASGQLQPAGGAQLFPWQRSWLPETSGQEYDPLDHPEVRVRDFQGTWLLDADGRRRGRLQLSVDQRGSVLGRFVSQQTGTAFEAIGKVQAATPHRLRLLIKFANSEQTFDLYLWTAGKRIMAGTTQLQGQRYGVVARRLVPDRKNAAGR